MAIMKFSRNPAKLTGKASSHRSSALVSRPAARHISSNLQHLTIAIILQGLWLGRTVEAFRVVIFYLEQPQ